MVKTISGMGLVPFLLDGTLRRRGEASNNSWEISLAEMLNLGDITGMGMSSSYASAATGGLSGAIKKNITDNALPAIGTVIGLTVGNALLKKAGTYRMATKLVRQVGLGKLVKFS
jgi:hypothetical protein